MTSPPSIDVKGPVLQTNNGDCTANVIGGDANLNCAPKPLLISDSQAYTAALDFRKNENLGGDVEVHSETTAYMAPDDPARTICAILGSLTTIHPTLRYSGRYIIPGAPEYPGISLAYVNDANEPLADAIDRALQAAKIVNKPLPRLPGNPGSTLVVVVRKP